MFQLTEDAKGLKSLPCQTEHALVQKRTTACQVQLHYSFTLELDLNNHTITAFRI